MPASPRVIVTPTFLLWIDMQGPLGILIRSAIVAKLSNPHGDPVYAGGSKKRTGQRRLTAVR